MKNLKFLVLAIVVSLISCEKPKEDLAPQPGTGNAVYKRILALGFNKNEIIEFKDYYLVEGDIMFKKNEQLTSPTPKLKQAQDQCLVLDINRNIRVYLDGSSFNFLYLTDALQTTINAYNNLNINLKFSLASSSQDADIVVRNSNLNGTYCGYSGFPTFDGHPCNQILIDEVSIVNDNNAQQGKLVHLLVHEMGHCIGLRHTNYNLNGNDWGIQIPDTPDSDPASVMNNFTCDSTWNGFSENDVKALNYLYPLQDDYVSVNSSMNIYYGASSPQLNITSNCSWTASSNQSWLTVNNSSSSTGSGTVYMTATENSATTSRSAIVTITYGTTNQTVDVIVTQAANLQVPPTFNFTLSAIPSTPICNVSSDDNPMASSYSQIDLWYIFGPYQTFLNQTVQIESATDPITFDHIDINYNNITSDWLEYGYDSTTKRLTFWAKSYPGQAEWAVISLTSGSVTRNISVKISDY